MGEVIRATTGGRNKRVGGPRIAPEKRHEGEMPMEQIEPRHRKAAAAALPGADARSAAVRAKILADAHPAVQAAAFYEHSPAAPVRPQAVGPRAR